MIPSAAHRWFVLSFFILCWLPSVWTFLMKACCRNSQMSYCRVFVFINLQYAVGRGCCRLFTVGLQFHINVAGWQGQVHQNLLEEGWDTLRRIDFSPSFGIHYFIGQSNVACFVRFRCGGITYDTALFYIKPGIWVIFPVDNDNIENRFVPVINQPCGPRKRCFTGRYCQPARCKNPVSTNSLHGKGLGWQWYQARIVAGSSEQMTQPGFLCTHLWPVLPRLLLSTRFPVAKSNLHQNLLVYVGCPCLPYKWINDADRSRKLVLNFWAFIIRGLTPASVLDGTWRSKEVREARLAVYQQQKKYCRRQAVISVKQRTKNAVTGGL